MTPRRTSPAAFPAFGEYARPVLAIALAYLAVSTFVNLRFHRVLWGVEWDKYVWYIQAWPAEPSLRWDMNRPPFYLAVAKAVNWLLHDAFRAGQVVSQVAGAGMVVLGGVLGAVLGQKRATAILAAALVAVDEGVLLFGMSCSTDMLFAVFSVAALAILLARWQDLRARDALGMGVLFGLAYTTRYQAVIFWAGAIPLLLCRAPRPRAAARVLPFLVGTAVGLAPAALFATLGLGVTPLDALGGIGFRHPHFTRLVGQEAGVLAHAVMVWRRLHFRYAFAHLLYMTSGVPLVLAFLGTWVLRARRSPLVAPWLALVATGVGYFLATGWNSLDSYELDDSRRFYLPLLPPLFAAAATGAWALRSAAARWTVAAGTVALLGATTVALHAPLVLAPPSEEQRLAERVGTVLDARAARVLGYPVSFVCVFPRFSYLQETFFFNGWGHFRGDAHLPDVPHDLVVLPAWILEGSRKAAGEAPWFLDGYERVVCLDTLCALRPPAAKPAPPPGP